MTSHSSGFMEISETMDRNDKSKPQTSFAIVLLLCDFLIFEQLMFSLLLCTYFENTQHSSRFCSIYFNQNLWDEDPGNWMIFHLLFTYLLLKKNNLCANEFWFATNLLHTVKRKIKINQGVLISKSPLILLTAGLVAKIVYFYHNYCIGYAWQGFGNHTSKNKHLFCSYLDDEAFILLIFSRRQCSMGARDLIDCFFKSNKIFRYWSKGHRSQRKKFIYSIWKTELSHQRITGLRTVSKMT